MAGRLLRIAHSAGRRERRARPAAGPRGEGRTGLDPIAPDPELNLAGNFLYMLTGERPSPEDQRALDIALILHADHELNASTFSARVTAATLSDMYSAITSAIHL